MVLASVSSASGTSFHPRGPSPSVAACAVPAKAPASDLSYYNWKTQTLSSNNSSTFQVIADNEMGLFFKHKRDRKTINVAHGPPSPFSYPCGTPAGEGTVGRVSPRCCWQASTSKTCASRI